MFSNKVNESYHRFLESVPMIKNSTDDLIAKAECNNHYFSSQPASDKSAKENNSKNYESGVAKKNSMKNVYEETLFKIEDERFEIDVNIERFRATIQWLEKLMQLGLTEDKATYLIEKIKKFQVVELIYGVKNDEMLKGIEQHRTNVIPIVIGRIKEKLDVIREAKDKYEKDTWVQSLDACFHRSLDQKSFSIKYYDKKLVLNKSRVT